MPQAFRVVFLSRIFFNTAPRSPKVGKNVDKSLIIAVVSKCSQSQTTLLFFCCLLKQFVAVCLFLVPNVTKQVFVHFLGLNV